MPSHIHFDTAQKLKTSTDRSGSGIHNLRQSSPLNPWAIMTSHFYYLHPIAIASKDEITSINKIIANQRKTTLLFFFLEASFLRGILKQYFDDYVPMGESSIVGDDAFPLASP